MEVNLLHKGAWRLILIALSLAPLAAGAGVVISGVDENLRDNIALHLKLSEQDCEAPAWKLRRLFGDADTDIRDALEAYGYYRPAISKTFTSNDECWIAEFQIDPGEPVQIRKLAIAITGDGSGDERYLQLRTIDALQPGQPLNHAAYDAHKRRFGDVARRRGYFDAQFTASTIDVYPEQGVADISIEYDTGRRYTFGPVEFDQDVITADLLKRFIDFNTGDPYEAGKISGLYEALLLTGYFERIDLATEPRGAPDYDVTVSLGLGASKPRTFTTGIGFGTDTGPRLRGSFIDRRRNPQGHQLEFSTSLSRVISETGLSYRIPLENPRAEWLSFDTGYKYEDNDTSRSKLAKAGIKRLRQRRSDWLETQFLELSYEDFRIGDETGTSLLLIPGINWTQARGSAVPRPLRGHRLNLQLSGTSEALGSDAQFFQVDVFGKLIRPLWPGARVILRAEAGTTIKDKFSDLPASVRYFTGGDTSVRGYDYKNLGPKNDDGQVIGGSHLLTGSIELDQQVAPKWSVALFADSGNAFQDFDNIDLKTTIGTGFRWYSPLGPVRFDVAVPLASDAPDSFRIHITLGPDL